MAEIALGQPFPGESDRGKSLWQHRDFLLLWGGQTVSEFGDQISRLALPLLAVTVIGASTFEVSVLGMLGSVAFLLLSLPAGFIVDRTAKRPLMLWCDAASFAVSALSLAFIRTPETRSGQAAGTERIGFRTAMREGLSFVLKEPILRKVVACTATSNFFSQAAAVISVVFLVRTLHATPAVVGVTYALGAIGGLLGGLLAARLARRFGSARMIWLAMAVPGPLYLLQPLAQPGWGITLYIVGGVAFSAMAITYNVGQASYRQAICPPELLGRMNASVRWIVWGTIPLGALFGGALGSWLGLRATLWICRLGLWGASLWLVFSPLRRMRDVPAAA